MLYRSADAFLYYLFYLKGDGSRRNLKDLKITALSNKKRAIKYRPLNPAVAATACYFASTALNIALIVPSCIIISMS